MTAFSWIIAHWPDVLQNSGIVGGLFFAGYGLVTDARVRRAQTLMDVTKQHREIWTRFDDSPELAELFDARRDLAARPLTSREAHFVSFVILHLRATFYARSAGIYSQPESLRDDIRDFFSDPAPRAAWEGIKRSHDRKFVAFIERNLAGR